ncbi:MAG: symmetrical bis(5'-nucleosyl)-tetraphosphatase [Myxococcales bacterium]|nr:symmetrical bis(5'-nucleosyl)-tetraphosphatase [Myxococcales bacterium]
MAIFKAAWPRCRRSCAPSRAGFSWERDRLWLTGDLVNRGPTSLEVLRWAYAHRHRLTTVLGNHDVHALLRFAGHAKEKKRDTLDALLAADDAAMLFDWLRQQPWLVAQPIARRPHVLVHAGLAPTWTVADAVAHADELAALLAAPTWRADCARLVGKGRPWQDTLTGDARLHSLLLYFTRVRTVARDSGEPDGDFDGEPADMPDGNEPWFSVARAEWRQAATPAALPRVVFGHWAALGVTSSQHHLSLDTGCVWGKRLTAVRLEDDVQFSVAACD